MKMYLEHFLGIQTTWDPRGRGREHQQVRHELPTLPPSLQLPVASSPLHLFTVYPRTPCTLERTADVTSQPAELRVKFFFFLSSFLFFLSCFIPESLKMAHQDV